MVFVKNSTFFLYVFFLSKKSKKETIFDILDRKEFFLDLKSEGLKKSKKSTFCKGVMVFVKKSTFSLYVFFF